MTWNMIVSWELRRRAVVGGRALDRAGRPYTDASALALNGLRPPRRFACHMRRDGSFFFLDVPPGRYTLDRCDAAGSVVQTKKVVVAPFAPSDPVPVVSVDLEIVDPVAPIR